MFPVSYQGMKRTQDNNITAYMSLAMVVTETR